MNAKFDITRVELATPRLLLREFRQSDLRDFYEYAKVDGVGQMAGWQPHGSIQLSQTILNSFIKEKKTFAIYHQQDRKVIGSLGVELYDEKNTEFDDYEGRELGFVLSRDYWGQGLMVEAVQAVINYLFKSLNYDFIVCSHFTDNNQSRRVQEKCGFVPYRRIKYQTMLGTPENPDIVDAVMNLLINPRRPMMIKPRHRETLLYPPLIKSVEKMWQEFCTREGIPGETEHEAWGFGCEPDILAALVAKGQKRATTSCYELYELEGERVPQVGDYNIILNSDGNAVCITRNIKVEVKRFGDVDEEYAYTEGEGDKSLKYWKDVHTEIFTQELKEEANRAFSDDTLVLCEIFEVVYK